MRPDGTNGQRHRRGGGLSTTYEGTPVESRWPRPRSGPKPQKIQRYRGFYVWQFFDFPVHQASR